MKKTTEAWLQSAESDLLLIDEILANEILTHLSAFHAQQAVEKSFKAIIEEFDLGFIRTHSLEMLYNIVSDKILLDVNIELLIILDQLYIDSRYPGELGLLPNGKPSLTEGNQFNNFAKDIFLSAKNACK